MFDLALEAPAGRTGQCSVANIEAELLAMVPNEVERSEDCFAGGAAQAPPELLQENGGALRWAEEEHCVDVGQVDAFVEEVGCEQCVHATCSQIVQCPLAIDTRRGSGHC